MPVKKIKGFKVYITTTEMYRSNAIVQLQHLLLRASFLNLVLVAIAGVMLRAIPFTDAIPFTFKNLLHGHSHFAFGGWIMPVLLALLMKLFPELTRKVAYGHWRNISCLLLFSAYGMLLSFPVQGYGLVSIIFSTLSVMAGYYLVVVLWKALKTSPKKTSNLLLKWGLFFLAISAIGPFATGPLIAMGKGGTPLYYNSVYFYLHFQYNGWFTFAVLALLYRQLENLQLVQNSKRVFKLFVWACAPSFALSLLWNAPAIIYNYMGGAAALLQLAGLVYLWKDVKAFRPSHGWLKPLLAAALGAFALKIILQLASALPEVAQMAYLNRNFIIAYLHLVLLGFISLFAMATAFQHFYIRQGIYIKAGLLLFLFSFITTELLLAGNASGTLTGITIPYFAQAMLLFSLPFPIGFFLIFYDTNQQLKVLMYLN
jgi:hypothetical protein